MNKLKTFLAGIIAGLVLLTACEPEEELVGPDRLFRPVIKGELISEGNYIQASWQKVKGAVSYKVQLSQDTFKTILVTRVLDTNTTFFENLDWDKLYQIQVRANAQDTTKNSKMSFLGSVKTKKFPSIMQAINPQTDITEAAVRVKWINTGAPVTSIKLLNAADKSLVREIVLTNQDINNQYRIISRLAGGTNYTVQLFSGTTLRGYESFTTKTALSGNLVDLREVPHRPSLLADTIPVVPAGSTIILKRGLTYNISSTVNLGKSLTILSGSDLMEPNLATLFFTNNFNFVEGSVIEYIDFKEVVLRSNSYGSRYIFNTTRGATVGRISFESCHAEIFRGLVRLQSGATTLDNFVLTNSVVDSVAGYGIIIVDNATCKANNITLRNSTIYKAEKIITSSKREANSVVLENLTVNEAPLGGNAIIDFGSKNVANGIRVENCIFGIGKSKDGVRAIREYTAGSETSVNVINSYFTADHVVASNPFPNMLPYPRTSFDLFQDPKAGNFRIKDASFAGKNTAGDPRWRP